MKTAWILFGNAAALIFALVSIYCTDASPRAIIFSFMLLCFLRFILIEVFMTIHRRTTSANIISLMKIIINVPDSSAQSYPATYANTGRPVGFGGYLIIMAILFFFAFIFIHVTADKRLNFSWQVFTVEIQQTLLLAVIYELKDLFWKGITIDFTKSREINFGYNTQPITVLALTILLSGAVVAIMQGLDKDPTPWVFMGIMLGIKHLYDFFSDLQQHKKREKSSL